MRGLIAAVCLALSGVAQAQTGSMGGPGAPIAYQPGAASRDTYICLIPDTQNLTSSEDHAANANPDTCAVNPADSGCPSPTVCAASPYCKNSWRATGRQLLLNLAYDLTGQWAMEDYRGFGDLDSARSGEINAIDHPRCDLILSLGDMSDIDDAIVLTNPTYGQLSKFGQGQIDMVNEFWQIIKRSGIPFLTLQGNHDPNEPFKNTMTTALNFSSLPFYYDKESGGLGYAIKTMTPTGKNFCVIGLPYVSTASALTWKQNTIGCGSGYPTIILHHSAVTENGDLSGFGLATTIDTAGNQEAFMFAGGHWTGSGVLASSKAGKTGTWGVDADSTYFTFFSNWQELNRHNNGLSPIYGITMSDSGGIYYTVIRVAPETDSITAWDWSPYWRRRTMDANVMTLDYTSSYSVTFDFDARFP